MSVPWSRLNIGKKNAHLFLIKSFKIPDPMLNSVAVQRLFVLLLSITFVSFCIVGFLWLVGWIVCTVNCEPLRPFPSLPTLSLLPLSIQLNHGAGLLRGLRSSSKSQAHKNPFSFFYLLFLSPSIILMVLDWLRSKKKKICIFLCSKTVLAFFLSQL